MTEIACGSKEFDPLFPFPPRGKPGREGVPPRRKHAAREQKALARSDAAGSPHKRAAAPLWIPRERGGAELGLVRTNRMFRRRKSAENRPTLENRLHRTLDIKFVAKKQRKAATAS